MIDDLRRLLREAAGDTGFRSSAEVVWRRGRRRRLVGAVAGGLGALVVAGAVIVAAGTVDGPRDAPPRPAPAGDPGEERGCPQRSSQGDPQFAPQTYTEGDRSVMPIAFLDGTHGDMLYAPDLALEDLAIQPSGHLQLAREGEEVVGGATTVSFAGGRPPESAGESARDDRGRPVTRWRAVAETNSETLLRLRLGCWLVEISSRRPIAAGDRRTMVDNLFGLEIDSGFMILDPGSPLRVCGVGECGPGRPELYLGDQITLAAGCGDLDGKSRENVNGLTVHDYGGGYRVWCDATGKITVGVADPELASRLVHDLTFRDVRLGGDG
ncbi:MAG TPA: hypothetical protein VHI71_05725 [Actinomycetota bacterium]|nr:hypothetical protein [Actinomycetota bacterium]